ncbi:MAG: methionine synthase [Rikenellaceae bacterium]
MIIDKLNEALSERILLLDGGLGTMVQLYKLGEAEYRGETFASWHCDLKGCNDALALTRPEVIREIHYKYLAAGADIITTDSFNANAISLADYGLESYSYDFSRAAATVASSVAKEFTERNPLKPRFVAGSVGPTSRPSSMSTDVSSPAAREVTFDGLVEAYTAQVNGLLDGGADIILVETVFDTLNAKAALYSIDKVGRERDRKIPTMLSGTLSDASGRTLSGQGVEAMYASLSHASLISVGLNCAFGAKQLLPYLERLAEVAECHISAHPNAGLPNLAGGYDETPDMFAADIEEYLRRGVINIVGGCCGTTPQHIYCLNQIIDKYKPRPRPKKSHITTLSGLDTLKITPDINFVNVGERSNVAGSAKFARLIREERFDEALSVVRAQVDAGAQIIDVCMDDSMIEGEKSMRHFLNLLASEPEIARVPLMVDSSSWEVLQAGLKVAQGKSVVNSISLKDGEQKFVERALEIHRMGAAAVVMLFDEVGQADIYERKIEIAERAYNILTSAGFPAEDIIFDPNILAVATGIEEHDVYAKAFIDATRWIKENLPYAKVSGGVSNLSFAFRGNNHIREAMHSAFLYHAIQAGMDMAIVNTQMLQIYDEIDPELLELIENVILYRSADASDKLIEYAQNHQSGGAKASTSKLTEEWRTLPLKERIEYAMTKGIADYIEADTQESYELLGAPMKVIDQMLMPAMEHVGVLFGEGKMFLPQVVKTARVMKQAVSQLTPYIEALKSQEGARQAGRVLIATVKGDVHDIGKNIVSVVMACNGYEIKDLGVMVETKRIVDEAAEWGADVICMSGLITPSLDEMTRVVEECEKRGVNLPIIIGGATTSPLHTAVKIAPHYSGVVIHAHNASDNPKILSQLLGEDSDLYIDHIRAEQHLMRADYERVVRERELLSLTEARTAGEQFKVKEPITPQHTGRLVFPNFDIDDVEQLIDWNFFFMAWGLKGQYPALLSDEKYGEQATKLFEDASAMLQQIKRENGLVLEGAIAILKARSEGDDIIVTSTRGKEVRMPMLRSQTRGVDSLSVADFVAEQGDHIGCFAVTAGVELEKFSAPFKEAGDEYNAMIAKLLADRLTEAFAQRVHSFVRREMWGYESGEPLSTEQILRGRYDGVRLAFGYPAVPDHSLKREVFDLLSASQTTRMKLTENFMISPGESICGLILPQGRLFEVGALSEEQVVDYAARRKMSVEEIKKLLPKSI